MTLRAPAFNDALTYGFEWIRYALELDNQEGVLNAGDLKVTAAAAGGMRVDVAAGTALVKGDSGVPGTGTSQGLFVAVNDAAIPNAVTLAAAHATLPRVDRVVLRVRDSSDLGSGADNAVIDFVTGVATSGATLDNLAGAVAVPNDCLLLADVLIPAAAAAVTAGNVRDRRKWARGVNYSVAETAGDYTLTGSWAQFTTSQRFELSGGPVEIWASGEVQTSGAVAGNWSGVQPMVDSVIPAESGTTVVPPALQFFGAYNDSAAGAIRNSMGRIVINAPAAGSHIIGHGGVSSPVGGIVRRSVNKPFRWGVRELVAQNATNT